MLKNNKILNVLVSRDLEQYKAASLKIDDNLNAFEALFMVLYRKEKGDDFRLNSARLGI